jgi:hypothetical protein
LRGGILDRALFLDCPSLPFRRCSTRLAKPHDNLRLEIFRMYQPGRSVAQSWRESPADRSGFRDRNESIEQGLQLRYDFIDDIFRDFFGEAATPGGDIESARLIAEDHALRVCSSPGERDGKALTPGVVAAFWQTSDVPPRLKSRGCGSNGSSATSTQNT